MAAGQVQTVVICSPSAFGQAPCPSGQAVTTMQAYVLDVSSQSSIEAQLAPFDYGLAAQFWGFAFTTTIAFYLIARPAGLILGLLRSR